MSTDNAQDSVEIAQLKHRIEALKANLFRQSESITQFRAMIRELKKHRILDRPKSLKRFAKFKKFVVPCFNCGSNFFVTEKNVESPCCGSSCGEAVEAWAISAEKVFRPTEQNCWFDMLNRLLILLRANKRQRARFYNSVFEYLNEELISQYVAEALGWKPKEYWSKRKK